MLGITGEHQRNERARRLVSRFVNVMSDLTSSFDPAEVSGPIQRGLSALHKLKNYDGWESQSAESTVYHGSPDGTMIDENGSLKLQQSSIMTPPTSDHSGTHEKQSPSSVLNTILWGNSGGYSA